jgi:hypothetical protein
MSVKVIETIQEENNSSPENKDERETKQQTAKKSVPMPIILSETTDAQ